MGEGTAFAQFRENKYGIFNWGLQEVHTTLVENLVQNPQKSINWANFYYSRNFFCNNTIQFSLIYIWFAQSWQYCSSNWKWFINITYVFNHRACFKFHNNHLLSKYWIATRLWKPICFFSRNKNVNKKEKFKEIQTRIQKYFSLKIMQVWI